MRCDVDFALTNSSLGNDDGVALRDDDLVAALDDTAGWSRLPLLAALGESQGKTGPDALRAVLATSGKGTADQRCTALLALGKRCGSEATQDFGAALAATSRVRDYALLCLGAWGLDGYWDDVYDSLRRWLRKPRRSDTSLFEAMVTYLTQHLAEGADREARLERLLTVDVAALSTDELNWLQDRWPSTNLPGTGRPDVERLRAEFRAKPLFQPIHQHAPSSA